MIHSIILFLSENDDENETVDSCSSNKAHYFIAKKGHYQIGIGLDEKYNRGTEKFSPITICISGKKPNQAQMKTLKKLIRSIFKEHEIDQTNVFGLWEIDLNKKYDMFDYREMILKNIFIGE